MQPNEPEYLILDDAGEMLRIAYRYQPSQNGNNALIVWLGGFKSDMDGSKAEAISSFAEKSGNGFLRFDYSGHGLSSGEFADGTISAWLDQAEALLKNVSTKLSGIYLVGSSMGGWIALLLNQRIQHNNIGKSSGMLLLAPAHDMTHDLMLANMSRATQKQLQENGSIELANEYSPEPYVITSKLIEDGQNHLFGNNVIETNCPVHIVQGGQDNDVPSSHAIKLASLIANDPLTYTHIPDGDHRLSRPQDLEKIIDILFDQIAKSAVT